MDDFLGVEAHLLGEIGLDRGALHSNGALGGGEVGQQLGVINLRKVDPGRAAAGKLGQGPVLLRDAADQFTGFLHDGQVSGEVGVQHIIHAQGPKKCYHFAFHEGAGFHPELLAQGSPYGRGGADNYDLLRIGDGLLNRGSFVPLHNAVHRTGVGTLTAIDADGVAAGLGQGVAAVDPHQLGTGVFAHAAPDAFVFDAQDAGVVRLNGNTDRQGQMGQTNHSPFCFCLARHSSHR